MADDSVDISEIRIRAEQNFGKSEQEPYISHRSLLTRARARRLESPVATVSSFADWVAELYRKTQSLSSSKSRGREGELILVNGVFKDLLKERRERRAQIEIYRKTGMAQSALRRFAHEQWNVEYDGITDPNAETFEVSNLRVNDEPLRAKPDLVLRHRGSGEILILELKTWQGYGRLPSFGWPNVKVQLWCYGLIKAWRDAPRIFLQGRVWKWIDPWDPRHRGALDAGLQFPGIVLEPWLATDPRVHRECAQLFEVYGGRIMLR